MRKLLALLLAFVPLAAVAQPQLPDYRWVNLERESPNYNDQIGLFRGQVQVGLYVWSEKAYYPIVGDKWGKPTTPPWPLPESWQPPKPPEQKEPPQWKASEPEQTPMPKPLEPPVEDKAPEDTPDPFDDSELWRLIQALAAGGGTAGTIAAAFWWARRRRTTKPDGTTIEEEETAMALIQSSHPLGGNPNFKRGLKGRTSSYAVAKMVASGKWKVHTPSGTTPAKFGIVPRVLSYWENQNHGDCVSAEECFFIACMTFLNLGADKEVVISDEAILAFCNQFGVLEGADSQSVMQDMEQTGITDGSNNFKDGNFSIVDYTKLVYLNSAIAQYGVVKFELDANALPSGAGNASGWYAFGGSPGQFPNTDHDMGFSGFGTAADCFGFLGIPVPSGVDPNKPDCVLAYTWKTIGVVDLNWILSTVVAAYGRDSCIMNGTPLTVTPSPQPSPTPGPTPGPTPTPGSGIPFGEPVTFNADGTYTEGGASGKVLQPDTIALLERDLGLTGGDSIVIPPIILVIIKGICLLAPLISPLLPPGVGAILIAICGLLPKGVKRKDGSLVIPYTAELRTYEKVAALGGSGNCGGCP